MNKILLRIIVFVTLLCLLLFSGCSSSNSGSEYFTVSVAQDYPVEIGGVTIKSCPRRVISLSPVITEAIYSLGSNSQLIGVSDHCDYPDIKEDMARVGTVNSPNSDKIISLDADLVLTSVNLPPKYQLQLTDAGITIAVVNTAKSYNDIKTLYNNVASAVSGKHTGANNAKYTYERIDNRIKSVAEKYKGEKPKKAVLILVFGEAVATGDTASGELLQFAGADNIAKSANNFSFSIDEIAASNPQHIFCKQADISKIYENKKLQTTDAVKNGRVYDVNITLLERQGDRMYDTVLQIANHLHPQAGID